MRSWLLPNNFVANFIYRRIVYTLYVSVNQRILNRFQQINKLGVICVVIIGSRDIRSCKISQKQNGRDIYIYIYTLYIYIYTLYIYIYIYIAWYVYVYVNICECM